MDYRTDRILTPDAYIELLNSTTLGARRPVEEPARIAAMLAHANLLATAWDGDLLVGAARCMTDYAFVTYCADLAVRESHQRQGIGLALLKKVLEVAPCRIVLLAAPQAAEYYPRIGFTRHLSAWTVLPEELRP
jgi:GNAT superfamily N-acetyltransferase